MDEFMTTAEVARTLRTSPETVRYWRHVGRGPASFRVGRRVLYASADVERWIVEQRAAESGRRATDSVA
ncbi:helix-turn-helix domain-containing protein [Pseudonocardia sp.]|uniref:helix-turn-helix domain-containing protein n=1 Tax=Pseudonocardia sp. TaxID=60912 RepID=UPI00262ED683|nr:helix-turn-helix domain-containing protein [Pseudonocardia sp.]